jgi:sporulation protein YlmC with PRC-barrel domain
MESVDEDIKGKNVLNTKGEQIAELDDVVIDSNARIVGYHLSKVFMEGPVADTKRIHVKTTEVLGADALIIDTSKLYRWVFES